MQSIKYPLSIITVCYNSEKTLKRTIESVLKQETQDFEYIIIDGASKDSTIDIVKEFETRFGGRLHYISEPDNGIYDAFNKGIKYANGAYIWFVNSDDYIENNAVSIILDVINPDRNVVCIHSFACNYLDSDGTPIQVCSSDDERALIGYKKDWMGCPHPGVVVSKKVYDLGFIFDTNYKIMGDLDWFHSIYKAKIPILFHEEIISNFIKGGISTSENKYLYSDIRYYFHKHYSNIIIRFVRHILWMVRDWLMKH